MFKGGTSTCRRLSNYGLISLAPTRTATADPKNCRCRLTVLQVGLAALDMVKLLITSSAHTLKPAALDCWQTPEREHREKSLVGDMMEGPDMCAQLQFTWFSVERSSCAVRCDR